MGTSAFDETFGVMPHRPDHPDFDELVQVLLALDGRIQEGQESMEAVLERIVDPKSVSYVSLQRAFRIAGVTKRAQLQEKQILVTQLASVWVDGFMVGAAFRKPGALGEDSPAG